MQMFSDLKITIQTKLCGVCLLEKPINKFLGSGRDFRVRNVCEDCRTNNPNESKEFFIAIRTKTSEKYSVARLMARNIYHLLAEETKTQQKEVNKMSVKKQARDYLNLPDKIAAIIGKTYAVRGDDEKAIPDDIALMKIKDLLDELDPTLVERNKNKRLSR